MLVVLLSVAGVVSAVTIVAAAAISVYAWYERHYDWRDHAYHTLATLHAGYTREKFVDALGVPVFDRTSSRRHLREATFRGREYWVQIVSDRSGTVLMYSITSCADAFRPSFVIPGAASANKAVSGVTLNKSTFQSVLGHGGGLGPYLPLDYYGSGATANSHFYDFFAGGNPSNYKTFGWGIDDVCPGWFTEYARLYKEHVLPANVAAAYKGRLGRAPTWVRRFRRELHVNTYVETAPNVSLDSIQRAFQVGADRILTRTVDDPDARIDSP
jgi:hypothetical protein